MSIARHHNEWLSLIEQSGPFLSVPVLMESDVFSTGLDPHDPDLFRSLRIAYDEWRDQPHDLYGAWIEFILRDVLGYTDSVLLSGQTLPPHARARIAEHGESIVPDYALVNPDSDPHKGKLRLLIRTVPVGQDLDKPLRGMTWKASPNTRMVELLHSTDTRLGLVTNGEDWTLIHAPRGETSGFATWKADLWCEESITLRAFRSLLTFKRFFGIADENTIEKLYERSAQNQQEVTDQLGLQVRHAVEILVSRLDRLDQDNGRDLLRHIEEKRVYEAALTVMMRLVFLMCAEERGLFPMDEPIYAQHYAVTTLRDALDDVATKHGEEILERRHDAWVRLLALFRLIYGGSNDDRLRIVAYGGGLFDPDRFSFLEGRMPGTTWRDTAARPLPVDNRTVLHLLKALQVLQINGEARRLSFRALDIEQIGHVYEGLLDHTAIRALPGMPVVGLSGTSKKEPEFELARLEALRADSDEKLIAFLTEESGRSDGALWNSSTKPKSTAKRGRKAKADAPEDLFAATPDSPSPNPDAIAWPVADHDTAGKILAACNGDQALYRRILPFAGLIRTDTFGNPVVIPGGAIYVTQGNDRRSTGTHYTPRSLTEPIVQYTLEPLVYIGPAEGFPKEEWKLRSPRELLDLKICDMAMGSGAFLVQACRYMSERLVESWELAEREAWSVEREALDGLRVAGSGERDALPKSTQEVDNGGEGLQRPGGVAAFDEAGRGMLQGNEALPEGGAVRHDESNPTSSGIDSSQHRGGSRSRTHQGISESSQHRSRLPEGTGDPSHSLETSRTAARISAGGDDAALHAHQPNALPPASIPAPQSEVATHPAPRTPHPDSSRSPLPGPRTPLPDSSRSPHPAPRTPITFPYADPITGRISERPLPVDLDERIALARRAIAERCLYGVDKNPLAVEIAKLSLWLITLDKGRPFTFVDHALKAGDSLLGLHDPKQLENFHLDPKQGELLNHDFVNKLAGNVVRRAMTQAADLRRQLEGFVVNSPRDAARKHELLREAEAATDILRTLGDLIVGAQLRVFRKEFDGNYDDLIQKWMTEDVFFALDEGFDQATRAQHRANLERHARTALAKRDTFHWAMEFPEVFSRSTLPAPRAPSHAPGFSAFVGNPPFQGGKKITGAIGTDVRDFLVERLANGLRGNADLCAYFFMRAHEMLVPGGGAGLIATNTIAQGDTREVGLEQMVANGATIYRATGSRKWPGVANLEISEVWWTRLPDPRHSTPAPRATLNGIPVPAITPFLTVPGRALGKPHRLVANEGKSFIGSYVLGMGFVLEPEEAQALIAKDPRNRDVLFPYLNGEDLNSRPDQSPSRWVINFKDWPLERDGTLRPLWKNADEKERKKYLQRGVVPADYDGPVARDYPDCFDILDRLVKPERTRRKEDGSYQLRYPLYERWWHYGDKRPELYATIEGMERVLGRAITGKHHAFGFISAEITIDQTCPVYCFSDPSFLSVLQANLHQVWWLNYGPTIGAAPRYTPSDCFETFPFPASLDGLDAIGERYHEHRRQVMLARQEGLTKTYNRFHNPKETSDDIQTLRDLHVEMDRAVLDAYRQSPGEADIWKGFGPDDLEHGFHETKQGLRFTVSERARRELLDRLLELNHKRYAEEVAAGLHDKKKAKGRDAASGKPGAKGSKETTANEADTDDLFGEVE